MRREECLPEDELTGKKAKTQGARSTARRVEILRFRGRRSLRPTRSNILGWEKTQVNESKSGAGRKCLIIFINSTTAAARAGDENKAAIAALNRCSPKIGKRCATVNLREIF